MEQELFEEIIAAIKAEKLTVEEAAEMLVTSAGRRNSSALKRHAKKLIRECIQDENVASLVLDPLITIEQH